jgi:hypothetical protein
VTASHKCLPCTLLLLRLTGSHAHVAATRLPFLPLQYLQFHPKHEANQCSSTRTSTWDIFTGQSVALLNLARQDEPLRWQATITCAPAARWMRLWRRRATRVSRGPPQHPPLIRKRGPRVAAIL